MKQTAINARHGILYLDRPEWEHVSRRAKDFVKQLLQTDPDKRPSSAQCFQSMWIRGQSGPLERIYEENVVREWTKRTEQQDMSNLQQERHMISIPEDGEDEERAD